MIEILAATTATSPQDTTADKVLQFVLPAAVSLLVALLSVWALLSQYKQKVDDAKEDIKALQEKKDKLRTDVDQLLEFKTQAQKFIDKSIYNERSPLSLTTFGKQLVNQSGFKDIFETEKDNLVSMLHKTGPTTQYEVQEKARSLMDSLTSYAAFKPIQDYAFSNGKDFNQILRAGAILLRDYYFEKYPEIVNPNEQY